MNVEVLGDDICYGASMNTVFRKQSRLGDDFLGLDFTKIGGFFTKAGKSIVSIGKSPTGKVVGSSVLTSLAARLTPTQKAQVAKAQEIAGIQPSWVPAGLPSIPANKPDFTIPYIVGGIGVIAIIAILVKNRK